MADQPITQHVHDNTPEQIAYNLFLHIARLEEKSLNQPNPATGTAADRDYVLSTYAQCLQAVKHPAPPKPPAGKPSR